MASENRKTLTNGDDDGRALPEDGVDEKMQAGSGAESQSDPTPESEDEYLKQQTVRAMLSHVIDPEVGLDILTMGLIYDVDVSEPGIIRVDMTLTTKGCPMSAYITGAAEQAIRSVYPDDDIRLQLVWDPPWSPALINRDGLALLRR